MEVSVSRGISSVSDSGDVPGRPRSSHLPLLELGGEPSPLVPRMVDECGSQGFDMSIEAVDYEFQRGGNEMMRIRRVRTDG